jgi:hypothetical protein
VVQAISEVTEQAEKNQHPLTDEKSFVNAIKKAIENSTLKAAGCLVKKVSCAAL